jgi:hypothetical protein
MSSEKKPKSDVVSKTFTFIKNFTNQLEKVCPDEVDLKKFISEINECPTSNYPLIIEAFKKTYEEGGIRDHIIKQNLTTAPPNYLWISDLNIILKYKGLSIPLSDIYNNIKNNDFCKNAIIIHLLNIFKYIESDSEIKNLLKKHKPNVKSGDDETVNNQKQINSSEDYLENVMASFVKNMNREELDKNKNDVGAVLKTFVNALSSKDVEQSVTEMSKNMSPDSFKPEMIVSMLPKMQNMMAGKMGGASSTKNKKKGKKTTGTTTGGTEDNIF